MKTGLTCDVGKTSMGLVRGGVLEGKEGKESQCGNHSSPPRSKAFPPLPPSVLLPPPPTNPGKRRRQRGKKKFRLKK